MQNDHEILVHSIMENDDCGLFEGIVLVFMWVKYWMTTYQSKWYLAEIGNEDLVNMFQSGTAASRFLAFL
jgi:hypothetical protein